MASLSNINHSMFGMEFYINPSWGTCLASPSLSGCVLTILLLLLIHGSLQFFHMIPPIRSVAFHMCQENFFYRFLFWWLCIYSYYCNHSDLEPWDLFFFPLNLLGHKFFRPCGIMFLWACASVPVYDVTWQSFIYLYVLVYVYSVCQEPVSFPSYQCIQECQLFIFLHLHCTLDVGMYFVGMFQKLVWHLPRDEIINVSSTYLSNNSDFSSAASMTCVKVTPSHGRISFLVGEWLWGDYCYLASREREFHGYLEQGRVQGKNEHSFSGWLL